MSNSASPGEDKEEFTMIDPEIGPKYLTWSLSQVKLANSQFIIFRVPVDLPKEWIVW
jgi:hypothetical protein